MTPKEIKKIVNDFGGARKLSIALGITPRAIYHWCTGKRKIRLSMAMHIKKLVN